MFERFTEKAVQVIMLAQGSSPLGTQLYNRHQSQILRGLIGGTASLLSVEVGRRQPIKISRVGEKKIIGQSVPVLSRLKFFYLE